MQTVRRLALTSDPLEYDIIFNFNNGEEMGLFGGYSFLLHPWFKAVKAFINLGEFLVIFTSEIDLRTPLFLCMINIS